MIIILMINTTTILHVLSFRARARALARAPARARTPTRTRSRTRFLFDRLRLRDRQLEGIYWRIFLGTIFGGFLGLKCAKKDVFIVLRSSMYRK